MAPPTKDKSVRFAESAAVAPAASSPAKRSKETDGDGNNDDKHRFKKRPRTDRPNEDELDDVDDWVGDDEEDEPIEGLPSEKERLEAKRARRQKREAGGQVEGGGNSDDEDAFESTNIDNTTSLATEGVTIEPFHMENERRDGTGYFDGDTYIFRKRDADEEPDAWLESLGDTKGQESAATRDASESSTDADVDEDTSSGKWDNLSKEELYAKIVPLVSDTETVMQALVRYGALLKRKPLKQRKKHNDSAAAQKDNGNGKQSDSMQSESFQMAQTALNELTETSNALLSLGDVDIYQKTRNDVLQLLPSSEVDTTRHKSASNAIPETSEPTESGNVSWEYKGTQDGEIHGPYSTQQMKAWVQAGYFKGAQVRTIKRHRKSTVDDMLSDLMDDDDDAEGKESKTDEEFIRGEWEVSDNIDFDAYS